MVTTSHGWVEPLLTHTIIGAEIGNTNEIKSITISMMIWYAKNN